MGREGVEGVGVLYRPDAADSRRRSELRAEAHKLSPIVLIGDKGLTDEVLAEIDRSLKAHD